MAKHSRIGASIAHRWFACPGSVALCEVAPPQEKSIYAEQGIAAHWVIEQIISKPDRASPMIAGLEAPNGYTITEEDEVSIRSFFDFLNNEITKGKFILHSEARFDLPSIHPDLFGTADVVLMSSDLKKLVVIDYKHGSGVPVEVENNKQLLYYALGAIQYVAAKHKIDYLSVLGWGGTFKEVEIVIAQPRARHRDGAIRRWSVSADVLDAFAAELKEKADATKAKNAPLVVGEHCRFCPALAICPAFNNNTFALAKADFKGVSDPVNLKLPEAESLSKPEIAKILRFADLIGEWLKAVESHAQILLEHGEELTGWKLVKKRANRKWISEEKAEGTLSLVVDPAELYEKKFRSPAQIEKVIGKKHKAILETLVEVPDNGNTIAPEHDPREPVKGSAVEDFTALSK